jgi:ADP-ribosylglycohydrolase
MYKLIDYCMETHFARKLLEVVKLTAIADTIGAPLEMYTRQDLLLNIDKYLHKFPVRNGEFNVGCQPGEYSDDTQQTIAMARHIARLEKNGYEPFNFELFMQDLLDVYDEDEKEKNVPRGCHGSFAEIANHKGNRINYQLHKNQQMQTNLGNGSGMRLNPFMVSSLSDKQLFEYVIGTTLSTHNNIGTAIGNILVVNILKILYNESTDAICVIKYSLDFLKSDHMNTIKKIHDAITEKLPSMGNFDDDVNYWIEYLTMIDELPDCNNDLTNIDPMVITKQNATICDKKNGTGLPGKAIPTIGWFHYLIKNLHSCQTPLDIIKRCLLVGGDTDTLAVYVYPISHIVFSRKHNNAELPEYIMNQLLETDTNMLQKRIGNI